MLNQFIKVCVPKFFHTKSKQRIEKIYVETLKIHKSRSRLPILMEINTFEGDILLFQGYQKLHQFQVFQLLIPLILPHYNSLYVNTPPPPVKWTPLWDVCCDFRPAFGCCAHPKADRNIIHNVRQRQPPTILLKKQKKTNSLKLLA